MVISRKTALAAGIAAVIVFAAAFTAGAELAHAAPMVAYPWILLHSAATGTGHVIGQWQCKIFTHVAGTRIWNGHSCTVLR